MLFGAAAGALAAEDSLRASDPAECDSPMGMAVHGGLDFNRLSERLARAYGSPMASLYSVLEPLSARCVRDISLQFEYDCSQVTWIATANDARLLDQPLRSRFREFHITTTAAECMVLAAEVMRAAIESVGVKGFKTDVSLRRHLAHLSARHIQQLTLEAIAHAVAAGRKALRQEDFPPWLFDHDATPKSGNKPNYMH